MRDWRIKVMVVREMLEMAGMVASKEMAMWGMRYSMIEMVVVGEMIEMFIRLKTYVVMCRVKSYKGYMGKHIMIVTVVGEYKMKPVWGYRMVMDCKVMLRREPRLMGSGKRYIMIMTEVWDCK